MPPLQARPPRPTEGELLPQLPAAEDLALPGPPWLAGARRAARSRFLDSDLPTEAEEVWRYSRIDELDLSAYAAVSPGAGDAAALPAALRPVVDAIGPVSALAVEVDGRVSVTGDVAAGVEVQQAGDEQWPLGAVAGEPDAFVALNGALMAAPLRVKVARTAAPGATVVVVHWAGTDGAALFPRLLVDVEDGAEASVVQIVASPDVRCLVVPVTELEVGAGANLRYTNVQLLGPRAWQVGLQSSRVARDGGLVSASIALGGDYARVRTDSTLVGQGASGRLLAVWLASGAQMPDLRTKQDHRAPKTTSDLLFKGAVANRSHSVYTGVIRVEKGAQGSSAMQTNRNLVIDEGAQADSVPNLEIEDNDVRCSHASAVGPIEEDQRFYLESRGVPPETADRLITLGFLDDALAQVPAGGLVDWLRLTLADKLEAAGGAS